MANRNFTSQFIKNFERQPVMLMGAFTQTATGGPASVTTQGLTLTAVTWGTKGNSITIAFTGGGTAGSEVVTVTGNAISVQIQSGTSTVTQVRTAMQASTPCTNLVTTTGTSSSTVSTAAATSLTGGLNTTWTIVGGPNNVGPGMTLSQLTTGTYRINLADPYTAMLGCELKLQRSTAVDLKSQIKATNTTSLTAPSIDFFMLAVATPTNMANSDILYVQLVLKNSGP